MKAKEFDRKFDSRRGHYKSSGLVRGTSSWASAEKSKRRFSPLDD